MTRLMGSLIKTFPSFERERVEAVAVVAERERTKASASLAIIIISVLTKEKNGHPLQQPNEQQINRKNGPKTLLVNRASAVLLYVWSYSKNESFSRIF